jgi:hypothetical protein
MFAVNGHEKRRERMCLFLEVCICINSELDGHEEEVSSES